MKKLVKWIKDYIESWRQTYIDCIESGALDFSGQGRDKWGN